MAFDYDFAVRFLLVLLAVVILAVLIIQYRKKNTSTKTKTSTYTKNGEDGEKGGTESFASHSAKKKKTYNNMKEKYQDKTEDEHDSYSSDIKVHQPVKASKHSKETKDHESYMNNSISESKDSEYTIDPIENENNDDYKAVDFQTSQKDECYPKDRLTPEDLLPKDAANSVWAENNPAGQGDVKDQNFLQAGVHFGVDTVGQSLRNANMQLRSDPPIPKVDGLSPWMNTTIEYDTNRRFLEIGS